MITIRGSEGLSDRIKEGATQIVDGFKYFSSGDLSLPMMAMQEAFGLKDILVGLLTSRFGDYRLDIKNDVFTLQRVPTHQGFATAMMDVVYGLDYYVKKHPEINEAISQGKVDFFVTGHSLGGSVTNLLCATFLNALQENGNKVFGYSMAAPKTIHFFEGYSLDGYDNIWNIVIPEDFIPTAYPGNATNDFPTVWSRYGNDRYITYTGNLDTHHSYSYIAGLLLETQ